MRREILSRPTRVESNHAGGLVPLGLLCTGTLQGLQSLLQGHNPIMVPPDEPACDGDEEDDDQGGVPDGQHGDEDEE